MSRKELQPDEKWAFFTAWNQFAARPCPIPVPLKFAESIEYLDKKGRRRKRGYEFDWAFIDERVAVEIDGAPRMVKKAKNGRYYAVGGHDGEKDHAKENLAAALGWRVMHFSPREVKNRPEECVEIVMMALKWRKT